MTSPLDLTILEGLDHDDILDLIQCYIDEMKNSIIPSLQKAINNEDKLAIKNIFHSIKGASLNIGSNIIGNIAKKINDMPVDKININDINTQFKHIQHELNIIHDHFDH